jgi:hypothetical protein
MALEDIDPQFRMDAAVAPTFKCENYDAEQRTFEVFYNDGTLKNESGMLGQVQTVPMEALMKHKEAMAKKSIQNVDPVVNATTVVNVYSEDDFDEQFEALSAALSEEE